MDPILATDGFQVSHVIGVRVPDVVRHWRSKYPWNSRQTHNPSCDGRRGDGSSIPALTGIEWWTFCDRPVVGVEIDAH
jgi:hypothetical protein